MVSPACRPRAIAVGVIWLACLLLALEAVSFVVIGVTARLGEEEIRRTVDIFREQTEMLQKLLSPDAKLLQLDSELGWRYRSGYHDSRNQMNSQGLRSAREYSSIPGSDVIRVAAFGDSFVYCNEVANADSWPTLIQAMFPHMEVLNYGVGGYGTDQALLRYVAEGSLLSPDVVIIGFAPVNLRRVVNVYRRFISNRELPVVKPRFMLDADGELVLLRSPLRGPSDYERYLSSPGSIIELGRNDQWYESALYENPLYDRSATVRVFVTLGLRIYNRYFDSDRLFDGKVFNRSSTAFKIQTALLERFSHMVDASGATPIVVIFPDRDAIADARRGKPKVYDPLVEHLRQKGIRHVDLTEAFVIGESKFDIGEWFMPGGHYSPLGNRRVASILGRYIEGVARTKGRTSPGPVSQAGRSASLCLQSCGEVVCCL